LECGRDRPKCTGRGAARPMRGGMAQETIKSAETPILEPRDWNRDGVGTASPARNVERWRDLHGRGYFDKHPHYQDRLHRRGLDRVESMLRPTREDVFLDVGCGYGRMLYHVAPMVRLAIGLDVASEPIQ